jgi:hypothetical protein
MLDGLYPPDGPGDQPPPLALPGVAAALITLIPRLKAIAAEPSKIVYVVTGSALSPLFTALALGASLHAVGEKASLPVLLVVIAAAAMVGGAVPVPGGAAWPRPA